MKLRLATWIGLTGWILVALLAYLAAPRIRNHFFLRVPALKREQWAQVLAHKKSELAPAWHDPRPLMVIAGDSQIEMGDWYDLFGGAFAIRNCGLSRAKIEDVSSLIPAIGGPRPKIVVLMCGENNIFAKDSVATCLKDYRQLLAVVQTTLQPERLLVLSVMPVKESVLDPFSQDFNRQVAGLNHELAPLCPQFKAEFVNVNPVLLDHRGGLAAGLTLDGLHLNGAGYQRLAGVLTAAFAQTNDAPVYELRNP